MRRNAGRKKGRGAVFGRRAYQATGGGGRRAPLAPCPRPTLPAARSLACRAATARRPPPWVGGPRTRALNAGGRHADRSAAAPPRSNSTRATLSRHAPVGAGTPATGGACPPSVPGGAASVGGWEGREVSSAPAEKRWPHQERRGGGRRVRGAHARRPHPPARAKTRGWSAGAARCGRGGAPDGVPRARRRLRSAGQPSHTGAVSSTRTHTHRREPGGQTFPSAGWPKRETRVWLWRERVGG